LNILALLGGARIRDWTGHSYCIVHCLTVLGPGAEFSRPSAK